LKNTGSCVTLEQMSKKILQMLLLVFLGRMAMANEVKFLIGMNSSKYLFSSEISSLNRQQKTGLATGLGWSMDIKTKLKFEINLLYSQKGAKVELPFATDKSVSGIYKNSSLSLPLFLKYQLNDKASPYAALGPEFVFILSHQLQIPASGGDFPLLDNTRKFVFAFNVLLGYEWPIGQWGFFAEVRYNRWLSNFWVDGQGSVKSEAVAILLGGIYYL
jgi:opacity protein-like surface antigen